MGVDQFLSDRFSHRSFLLAASFAVQMISLSPKLSDCRACRIFKADVVAL
jgi:hypothetical protein